MAFRDVPRARLFINGRDLWSDRAPRVTSTEEGAAPDRPGGFLAVRVSQSATEEQLLFIREPATAKACAHRVPSAAMSGWSTAGYFSTGRHLIWARIHTDSGTCVECTLDTATDFGVRENTVEVNAGGCAAISQFPYGWESGTQVPRLDGTTGDFPVSVT